MRASVRHRDHGAEAVPLRLGHDIEQRRLLQHLHRALSARGQGHGIDLTRCGLRDDVRHPVVAAGQIVERKIVPRRAAVASPAHHVAKMAILAGGDEPARLGPRELGRIDAGERVEVARLPLAEGALEREEDIRIKHGRLGVERPGRVGPGPRPREDWVRHVMTGAAHLARLVKGRDEGRMRRVHRERPAPPRLRIRDDHAVPELGRPIVDR